MSTSGPLLTLLKSSFRAWISAKGFWLVALAALLPVALTGAWVSSHTADLEMTGLRVEPANPAAGDLVTITATITNVGPKAVGAFNATLSIHIPPTKSDDGSVLIAFPPAGSNVSQVEGLAPGESKDVVLEWNATGGAFAVIAQADTSTIFGSQVREVTDDTPERDEFNNYRVVAFEVAGRAPTTQPNAPLGLGGADNASTQVDLTVESVTMSPAAPKPGDNVTLTLVVRNTGAEAVENAPGTVRVSRPQGFRTTALAEERQNLSIPAGETATLTASWTATEGSFFLEGWVLPPAEAGETNAEDNYRFEGFAVDTNQKADPALFEPEPQQTIKNFYRLILSSVHIRVIVPLIALYYAAGVIADEREKGALAYLLSRPIPRWMIPVTKFVGSYAIAAVALVLGVVATYLLLFGATPEGRDVGFLTTPLLVGLLSLFVYGAVFTLLGTIFDRPYLIGLLFLLGWELVATVTTSVFTLANWVANLTITHHLTRVLDGEPTMTGTSTEAIASRDDGWALDQGLQLLPTGDTALAALGIVIAIGLVGLAASAAWMHRREFQVG